MASSGDKDVLGMALTGKLTALLQKNRQDLYHPTNNSTTNIGLKKSDPTSSTLSLKATVPNTSIRCGIASSIASSSTQKPTVLADTTNTIRINTRDREDLRFDLRKHKRRVEELYEGREFYELSSGELSVARKIIMRESQQSIAPTFHPPTTNNKITTTTNNNHSNTTLNNNSLNASSSSIPPIPTTVFTTATHTVNRAIPTGVGGLSNNTHISNSSSNSNSNITTSNGTSTNNSILSKLYAQDHRTNLTTSAGTTNTAMIHANKKGVVPSGSVPVTATLSNSSTLHTKPVLSRLQETQGIRLIGNSLVDYQKLMKNVQKDALQGQQQQEANNPAQQQAKQRQKAALLSEVDMLLNRKSTHDAEASEEWHQQYTANLQKLAKREFVQEKLDSIQYIEVQAFQCRTCEHHIFPTYPQLCKDMGHTISEITAIKRFFECAHCHAKDSTFTNKATDHTHIPAPPHWRCRCGQYRWVVKGKVQKTETAASALTGESLVASASESTSRRDSLEMAVRVSRLSDMR